MNSKKIEIKGESRRNFILKTLAAAGCLLPVSKSLSAHEVPTGTEGEKPNFGERFFKEPPKNRPVASPKEAHDTLHKIWETSLSEVGDERIDLLEKTMEYSDACEMGAFSWYMNTKLPFMADVLKDIQPILYMHDAAFQRVLDEMKSVEVEEGEVALWLVYNMGYVVKTSKSCFAVDLKHRRAEEMAPYLDFILITHKHGDHFDLRLCEKMDSLKKPVVSNFYSEKYMTKKPATFQFGEVSVKTVTVDHNKTLLNYVTTFEIDCGNSAGNCVIYHVGDANNYTQLKPSKAVDIFIPHAKVGLNIPKCVDETIKPKNTLISHFLEMGHHRRRKDGYYRVPWVYGFKLVSQINSQGAVIPFWGEKFLWKK